MKRPRVIIMAFSILLSKITVPGIRRLSNFLIDDFLDFTGWYLALSEKHTLEQFVTENKFSPNKKKWKDFNLHPTKPILRCRYLLETILIFLQSFSWSCCFNPARNQIKLLHQKKSYLVSRGNFSLLTGLGI